MRHCWTPAANWLNVQARRIERRPTSRRREAPWQIANKKATRRSASRRPRNRRGRLRFRHSGNPLPAPPNPRRAARRARACSGRTETTAGTAGSKSLFEFLLHDIEGSASASISVDQTLRRNTTQVSMSNSQEKHVARLAASKGYRLEKVGKGPHHGRFALVSDQRARASPGIP